MDDKYTDDQKKLVKTIKGWYSRQKKVKDQKTPTKDFKKFYRYYRKKQLPTLPSNTIPNSVTNMIFSIIETQLPIMTDNRPGLNVIPESETGLNDEQIEQRLKTAAIFKKLLDRIWDKRQVDLKVPASLKDTLITGTGFLAATWNPKLENGIGDVDVTSVSPLKVYPDETAIDINDADYLIVVNPTSIKKLRMEYPDKAGELKAEEMSDKDEMADDAGDSYIVQTTDATSSNLQTAGEGGEIVSDRANVITCWMRDDTIIEVQEEDKETGKQSMINKLKYPNGRRVKIVGDCILEDVENDLPDFPYPLVRILDYNFTDSFWGIGEIEQLMDKQDILNNAYNRLSRLINLCTSPVTVIDASTGIDPDSWVNTTGAVYVKNPGTPDPNWMIPPGSQSIQPIIDFIKINRDDMADMSGIHETSQGRRPAGVTSGEMVEQLNEGVYTRIRLKMRNFEVALEELGNMMVQLIQTHYTTERTIQIVSGEGEAENIAVNQLQSQPVMDDNGQPAVDENGIAITIETVLNDLSVGRYRVEVVAGSSLPKSKVMRLQKAEQYYNLGLFGDPQSTDAKGEILKHADWPNRDNILSRMKEGEAQQQEQAEDIAKKEIAGKLIEKMSINWKDLPATVQTQVTTNAGLQMQPQDANAKALQEKISIGWDELTSGVQDQILMSANVEPPVPGEIPMSQQVEEKKDGKAK